MLRRDMIKVAGAAAVASVLPQETKAENDGDTLVLTAKALRNVSKIDFGHGITIAIKDVHHVDWIETTGKKISIGILVEGGPDNRTHRRGLLHRSACNGDTTC